MEDDPGLVLERPSCYLHPLKKKKKKPALIRTHTGCRILKRENENVIWTGPKSINLALSKQMLRE